MIIQIGAGTHVITEKVFQHGKVVYSRADNRDRKREQGA